MLCHKCKKKVTKNVLSAGFNFLKENRKCTKYLSGTLALRITTKVYSEKKKERKKEGKETENKRKLETVKTLRVFAAGLRFPREPLIYKAPIGRSFTRDFKAI